jgi:hypothetical protein
MAKIAVTLGLGAFLVGASASACPVERAGLSGEPNGHIVVHCLANCGELVASPADASVSLAGTLADEDAVEAAYLAQEQATTSAMHAWMQSLASGLLSLLAVALAAIGLARLSNLRRPLPLTVLSRRPVPAAVVLSLLSPVVPPLVLMHAEREILPSPVLLMASACAALALSMLLSRRRLAARLRWAVVGPLANVTDGTLVLSEVEPRKLMPPPGARGRVPWFVADLSATSDGETARVALGQADVDERAARLLSRLANGGSVAGETLTVLGAAVRVPADAASVDPLCRAAPTQARIGRAMSGRALVTAGSPAELLRRLQLESALLGLLFTVCLAAAGLAFFS